MRPGGWIALGRKRPPSDPLAEAVATLCNTRNGGFSLDVKRAVELLEGAGCTNAHVGQSAPAPLELVLGKRLT